MHFVLEQVSVWGDYGDVLISGFAKRKDPDHLLALHRTGPFLPPISFPWLSTGGRCVVVSDEVRQDLQNCFLPGVEFSAVTKDWIVESSWHKWGINIPAPKYYPSGGEPSQYIYGYNHNQKISTMLPNAWEIILPVIDVNIVRIEDPNGGYTNNFIMSETYIDFQFFRSSLDWGYFVVNEHVANLLRKYSKWLSLHTIKTEPPTGWKAVGSTVG